MSRVLSAAVNWPGVLIGDPVNGRDLLISSDKLRNLIRVTNAL